MLFVQVYDGCGIHQFRVTSLTVWSFGCSRILAAGVIEDGHVGLAGAALGHHVRTLVVSVEHFVSIGSLLLLSRPDGAPWLIWYHDFGSFWFSHFVFWLCRLLNKQGWFVFGRLIVE
jgi:hypothetical protein